MDRICQKSEAELLRKSEAFLNCHTGHALPSIEKTREELMKLVQDFITAQNTYSQIRYFPSKWPGFRLTAASLEP